MNDKIASLFQTITKTADRFVSIVFLFGVVQGILVLTVGKVVTTITILIHSILPLTSLKTAQFIAYIPVFSMKVFMQSLLNSYFCFEYKANQRGWNTKKSTKVFEKQWIYFFGFGFVFSFSVELLLPKVDLFFFYLLFPLLICLSILPGGCKMDVFDMSRRANIQLPLF